MRTHGLAGTYRHGCRCDECKTAHAARLRDYQRRKSEEGATWAKRNPERRSEVRSEARVRLRSRSPEQADEDRARLRPDGVKVCALCRESLPLTAFGTYLHEPDGLRHTCRPCDAARSSAARLRRSALDLWEERGTYACIYCDAPYEATDHVLPRALEGTDDPFNLAPACAACNGSKNDTPVLEWLASRARGGAA